MTTRTSFVAPALLAIIAATLLQSTAASTYVVRDAMGWSVPSGGAAAYTSWASQHNFTVGDILIFNFAGGQHDLARVSKGNFDICNATGPLYLQTVGPTSFTLNSTGDYYFICTFDQHCSQGQKLSISVTSNSTAPSPPSSPSPAPSPTPTPTPTPPPPSPTPSPPPSSPPSPTPSPPPSSPPSPTPSPPPSSPPSPTPSPPPSSSPSPTPSGTAPPPPQSPGPSPGSSPSPPSPPSSPAPGSSPSPPTPPPPPSSAPRKGVVAPIALISMSIAVVGVLF